MASKNTPNVVKGDIMIISELSKHLKYSASERKFLIRLAKKGVVAVESMLEEAIAKVGKIKRSQADLSRKRGNLLVMIAEPENNQLFYFKIPHYEYKTQKAITFQFNKDGGMNTKFMKGTNSQSWRIWNQYRVMSFKELTGS